MTNIEIVPCNEHDLELLVEIAVISFGQTFAAQNTEENMKAYIDKAFNKEKIAVELANPNSSFFFAKINDRVAGYLKVNFADAQTEFKDRNSMEIERIYSMQDYYGKGVGPALMKKAIEAAKSANCEFIWLGVWMENPRAIRFYQKFAFEIAGTHTFHFGNDPQTDFLMKRHL